MIPLVNTKVSVGLKYLNMEQLVPILLKSNGMRKTMTEQVRYQPPRRLHGAGLSKLQYTSEGVQNQLRAWIHNPKPFLVVQSKGMLWDIEDACVGVYKSVQAPWKCYAKESDFLYWLKTADWTMEEEMRRVAQAELFVLTNWLESCDQEWKTNLVLEFIANRIDNLKPTVLHTRLAFDDWLAAVNGYEHYFQPKYGDIITVGDLVCGS